MWGKVYAEKAMASLNKRLFEGAFFVFIQSQAGRKTKACSRLRERVVLSFGTSGENRAVRKCEAFSNLILNKENETFVTERNNTMKFTKMHGLGNDYLYVFGEVPEDISALSIKLSERHFGAGSDGMIYISPSETADFQMRIFNADGSEANMCGNGIRCVGKYVYDRGYTEKTELDIETRSGIRHLTLYPENGSVQRVKVDMGIVTAKEDLSLPADLGAGILPAAEDVFVKKELVCMPVSVGNPHAVFFVKDAEGFPLSSFGPLVEKHSLFPGGVNAEFVEITGENKLRMRVWERGSGITMACGTGACASAFASVKEGFCKKEEAVSVELDGGTLSIEVREDGRVFMTGPAEFVYDGVYPADGGEE